MPPIVRNHLPRGAFSLLKSRFLFTEMGLADLYASAVAAFRSCPARECLSADRLQEIHRKASTVAASLPTLVARLAVEDAEQGDLSAWLAAAELALAWGDYEGGGTLLEPLRQHYRMDFRFEDVLSRCEYYEANGKPGLEDLGHEKRGSICPHAFGGMLVGSMGSITQCCGPMTTQPLGSLKDGSALDAYNSEYARAMRESVLDGSYRYCAKTRCPVYREGLVPIEQRDAERLLRDIDFCEHTQTQLKPRLVELSLDRSCNLSCPFCRKEQIIEPKPAVDYWDWILHHRLDELFRSEDVCIAFSGTGDPFMSRAYMNLMGRLNRREYPRLSIIMQTNGLLLTPKMWGRIRNLSGMISILTVSIDAATAETYGVLRRGGDFARISENLAFFKTLRDNGDIGFLKLNFLVQRDNFREMELFYELAKKYDADTIHFQQLENIFMEDPDGEFLAKKVDLPSHPNHEEFLQILKRPFLRDTKVQNSFEYLLPTVDTFC